MLRTTIVGAAGYAGGELAAIVARHPELALVGLFGSDRADAPRSLHDAHPRLRGLPDAPIVATSVDAIRSTTPDVVFLATPHEAAHDLVPDLLDAGAVVFDLSAAFRLPDAAQYGPVYGFRHRHAGLLAQAAYGLVELQRDAIAHASLVAVPGCYPTSVLLPTRPLVEAGLVDVTRPVIVDAVSGVSGAGRALSPRSHFCEVSLQAYGVFEHRHAPEIEAHGGVEVLFTPQLAAWERGILSTIHLELAPGAGEADVRAVLAERYADAPFVRVLETGSFPAVADVRHTNRCDIGLRQAPGRRHLVVSSAIDNLLKGAAGQAVQGVNVRFGLPETLGLDVAPGTLAATAGASA